jgi:enamidase
MATAFIKNIGALVSGDITEPTLNADTVFIADGKIQKIGMSSEFGSHEADVVIDAAGSTICPGLIDSHCHVVFGDFTPRQSQLSFLESELHGGVTTMISAGEVHLPGRPKDPAGVKALAIVAAKAFANFRPGGAKVIGGSVILEKGLTDEDFAEMAREGVRTVGEIGLGSVKTPEDAAPMVKWAKMHNMTVMMHTGGTSIPGSSTVTAEQVIATGPDVVSHINGGPTAVAPEEIKKLVEDTSFALEIVHCGNIKAMVEALNLGLKNNCLERFIIGNDAPSGTGVVSLGILRVIATAASLTDVTAARALCMATGNTARVHKLEQGFVKEGAPADLVSIDTPMGSVGKDAFEAIEAGDVPGVSMIMVDGNIVAAKSRNTPPSVRQAKVV